MKTRRMNEDEEPESEGKKPHIQKKVEEKFLEQRKIFLWGPVDDDSAQDIVSKLLYLESIKPGEKITFFINSPGGMVTSGFSILDTMNLISSPVSTVCMGLAASMGSLLLSAGEKRPAFYLSFGRSDDSPTQHRVFAGSGKRYRDSCQTNSENQNIIGRNSGKKLQPDFGTGFT